MVKRWGYHPEEEARIFDLGEGETLPLGWVRSPAELGKVTYPGPDEGPKPVKLAEAPKTEEKPADWRSMHWKQRAKLARELTGNPDITTPDAADKALEAHYGVNDQ